MGGGGGGCRCCVCCSGVYVSVCVWIVFRVWGRAASARESQPLC